MSDAQKYRLSMFAGCVGESFQVGDGSGVPRQLELLEATGRSGGAAAASEDTVNFSLVFHDRNASPDAHLPQATYRLDHYALGPIELFIVPIGVGKDGVGIRYEAIFASLDSP